MKAQRFYISVRSKRDGDALQAAIEKLLRKYPKSYFGRNYNPFIIEDVAAKESGRIAAQIAARISKPTPWIDLLDTPKKPKRKAA
jgi:hypothetical protein